MRICFISSEVYPFAKTGGLADVSGALPKYVSRHGHDVRVFMPLYSSVDTSLQEFHYVDFLSDIPIRMGRHLLHFSIVTSRLPGSTTDVYFVDCPALYHRPSIYTNDPDEYLRF